MGYISLKKKKKDPGKLHYPSSIEGYSEKWPLIGKQAFTTHKFCGTSTLDFPVSGTMRNKYLLFVSHQVYGLFLQKPEWTKLFFFPPAKATEKD